MEVQTEYNRTVPITQYISQHNATLHYTYLHYTTLYYTTLYDTTAETKVVIL